MTEPVRALLEGLIDYAGLFPPAALDLPTAATNYRTYLAGEYKWALGRFVVPVARLDEVDPTWKVSVIGIPRRTVDSCEIRIDRISDASSTLAQVPAGVTTYFEIPVTEDPAALSSLGARAKIRMGGPTLESYPSSESAARFLHACARAKVPFKATAGLHHPVRSSHDGVTMHGFVNVFLAAALAWHGAPESDALATLEETSPAAFHFKEDGVCWHGHSLGAGQIRSARREFAIGFGSCSFEEPVQDLRALGWL